MSRKFGAVLAGVAMVVVCLAGNAADEKAPTIKEVMKAVSAKDALCAKCAKAGKADNWEDAQKFAKQMNECGVALTKTKCPKGDADSWKKLTTKYCEQTAAVSKAAADKDSKAFAAALKDFTGSCKACHDAHK